MKMVVLKTCGVLLWFCVAAFCFGQDDFARGEALFMQNKPKEAAALLESAVAADPANVTAFLYLGIVYEQLNKNDEAVAAYLKIADRAGDLTAQAANNLGNVYLKKGNVAEAEKRFTQALEADPGFAPASLGRANARVKAGSLRSALADYEMYLSLEPRSSKRPEIERLIAFIYSELAAGEEPKRPARERERAGTEPVPENP